MATKAKTRNALDGEIMKIQRGLAIFKVCLSPYYRARMRNPKTHRYVVKSTKETSRIKAREVAQELYQDFLNVGYARKAPKNFAFATYAEKFLTDAKDAVTNGQRNPYFYRDAKSALHTPKIGLLKFFRDYDVREITTALFNDYIRDVNKAQRDISAARLQMLTATFRNVMKVAVADGAVPNVPVTPKPKAGSGNPRPFFRFSPLVDRNHDQYRKLLATIRKLAEADVKVRYVPLDMEFYDLCVFLTNSFLRPTYSELYALKHEDVTVIEDDKKGLKALQLNIRKGKTGARIATTMNTCVDMYKRICERYPDHKPTDYIFYPKYEGRRYILKAVARLLTYTLKEAGLEVDPYTKQKHTMYSFRHTAICMRLVLSKGKINVYTLAKNAGTSVEMIESNYAKKLPITGELVENLQSFGN